MNGIWQRSVTGILVGVVIGLALVGGSATAGDTPSSPATCVPLTDTAMSVSSETVFAANDRRVSATITNGDATNAIHVACLTSAASAATTAWERVPAGTAWKAEPIAGFICRGTIKAIAAAGTPAIGGSECSK